MPKTDGFESDHERWGRKFAHYQRAMDEISSIPDPASGERLLDETSFRRLLERSLLPALKQGSLSSLAFIADQTGKIIAVDPPEDTTLSDKTLPQNTPLVSRLIEKGDPLVVSKEGENESAELQALGVNSLLLVRLQTTRWGYWFIGVCNGRNEPEPYMGEDKKFIDSLMRVLARSLDMGASVERMDAEEQFVADRYAWSRLRGEWRFLARSSQDFARLRVERENE